MKSFKQIYAVKYRRFSEFMIWMIVFELLVAFPCYWIQLDTSFMTYPILSFYKMLEEGGVEFLFFWFLISLFVITPILSFFSSIVEYFRDR